MWKINLWMLPVVWWIAPALMAQSCDNTITATTPSSQFQRPGNGTVTDTQTGLMWKQCHEGQLGADCSAGLVAQVAWDQALQIPATVNSGGGFAGYTDWRLPNIKELRTIVEEQCVNPALNTVIFPGGQSLFVWSGSPNANDSLSYAWIVFFSNGSTDDAFPLNDNKVVRLVRSGQ